MGTEGQASGAAASTAVLGACQVRVSRERLAQAESRGSGDRAPLIGRSGFGDYLGSLAIPPKKALAMLVADSTDSG
jgi:hypothetical protein